MTIYGYVLPGTVSLARWAAKTENISEEAKQRLRVLDWLRVHDNNVSLTSRHFGVTRETIGIWKKKLETYGEFFNTNKEINFKIFKFYLTKKPL